MYNIFDWFNTNKNLTAAPIQTTGIQPTPVKSSQVAAKYINLHTECLDNINQDQKDELTEFVKHYYANENLYKSVGLQADVPAILVGAIHWRESSGDFTTYLSQGDKLGTRTYADGDSNDDKSLPEGTVNTILFPNTIDGWKEGAVFALDQELRGKQVSGITYDEENIGDMCTYGEYYNGTGYRYRKVPSPYVYSCTTCYTKGKFDDDDKYNPDDVDKQLGVLIMLRSLIS